MPDPNKIIEAIATPLTSLVRAIGEWRRRQRVYFWILLLFGAAVILPRWDCSNGTKNACLHLEWFYDQITGESK